MPVRIGCRWVLIGVVLWVCLGVGTVAQGQEVPAPPADAGGGQIRTPGGPGAPAEPTTTAPGAPSAVPAPIFPGFPPPTVSVGEPVGPIPPFRPLEFAPLPEGASPLQIRATVSVQEEYTDNANQTKSDKVEMFRTSVIPGLSVHANGARTNLDLAYTPQIQFQNALSNPGANTAADPSVNQSLTLRGGVAPTPQLQLNVAEDFTDSTDFRAVGNLGSTQTGQNRRTQNQATAEAAYTPALGRVGLAYTNVLALNDVANPDNSMTHNLRTSGDLNGLRYNLGGSYTLIRGIYDISSDYWEQSGEVHAKHDLTPTLSTTLSGTFTAHDPDQSQSQRFQIGRVRAGGVWAYSPEASLSAQAGVDVYAPRGATVTARPSAMALWTQRFSYFSVTASAEQSFQEDFQSVDNTGVSLVRSASLYLTSMAWRDLTATAGVRWNWQQFEQSTTNGGPAGTKQGTWDLHARLEYLMARPLRLALDYVYTIRSSTQPTAGFVENRVSLSFSYQYDVY